MFRGYTNQELITMFREPKQRIHNFIDFLNSIKPKEETCPPLKETSETTSTKDLESSSLNMTEDSSDTSLVEQTCISKNGSFNPTPVLLLAYDSLEKQSELEGSQDVQPSLVEMIPTYPVTKQ